MEIQNFLKFQDMDFNNTTFIMRQYQEIKAQYPDFIVFFRVGEFFETYFEDAINFSKACGVTITKRKIKNKDILMAGIPHKKLKFYIGVLLKSGFKTVVTDQTNELNSKGQIIRKVKMAYTGGCLYDFEYLNPNENNYLMAIHKKNQIYEFAYADVSTGQIYESCGDYTEVKCELARICPVELIVSENLNSEKELFEAYKFEFLKEEFFKGENENKALCALLNYTRFILKENTPKFDEIQKYEVKKLLLMDYSTRKNLELTKNAHNNTEKGSILWAIDYCKTPMGKRLLSSIISSPVYDIEEIKTRQEKLLSLFKNENLIKKTENALKYIGDISRLTSKMSNKSVSPLEFLTIKNSFINFKEFIKIKNTLKINHTKENKNEEKCLQDYCDILNNTLEDNIEEIKAGNFIKCGANPKLDILSEEHNKLISEIKNYEEHLQANIKSLKIKRKSGSYYIEINSQNSTILPEFTIIQKLKNTTRYTTEKLICLEEQIFSLEAQIEEVKKEVFENLKNYSSEIVETVRAYSKNIATLDVMYSLVLAAKTYKMSMPEFSSDGNFKIKNLGHVGAEKILNKFDFLNIELNAHDFVILTGQNGIGKSTLLKALGCFMVLFQAGCFAPCSYSQIAPIQKLFGVLGVSDEIINKKSTHQMQMKHVSFVLKNMENNTLVLLDEIGKNTSYKDGLRLCYGISKHLIKNSKGKTLFSTHFLDLKNLLKENENEISYLKITNENKRTIEQGSIEESEGILSAQKEDMPYDVIQYAKSII